MQADDQEPDAVAATGNVAATHEKTFQAEVTEEYIAEDDSQLTIKVGQIVTIYGEGEDQNGWFYGYYNSPDGTSVSQGYLPSTYVTPLKATDDSITKHERLNQYGPPSAFGSGDPQPYKVGHDSIEQPMISSDQPRSDDLAVEPDVDPTTILNIYTKHIEWLAAVILFLSGCLCIAHGTGTSKALGSFQLIFSISMIPYLYLRREAFYDSPAILRAGIWFIASIFAWAAPPAGLLGGVAATLAMCSNVHSHLNDSGPTDRPFFWEKLIEEFGTYSIMNYGIMIAWVLVNICVWFGGKGYGSSINKHHLGGLINQMEGIEGCGFIISFNLMCMAFMSCRYILENLSIQLPMPFAWLCDNWLGIQYALFATITIGTIGHIFASFDAYNSDDAKVFIKYFGGAPLGTGVIIFAELVGLWAVMISPNLFWRGPAQRTFTRIHGFGISVIVVLLLFHGKDGWNTNYWKWMIAPAILFIIDRVMRMGSGGSLGQAQ